LVNFLEVVSRSRIQNFLDITHLLGVRRVYVKQAAQPFAQFRARAMQAASHGPHGNTEQGADFLVPPAVEILENHDGSVVGPKLIEGRLNNGLAFDTLEGP
jgi:hypothetical protein